MNKTPKHILEATKRWQARNPEYVKAASRKWIESGRSKKYYHANREKLLARNARLVEEMRINAINLYGGKCIVCKEKDIDCLAIDHINNDGYKDKIRAYGFWKRLVVENDPHKYQVLCHNHNWKKHLNNLRKVKYGTRNKRSTI